MRVKITLACTECKQRNYDTMKNKKSECRKIVWPTREQTTNNTLVVIACVVIIGIFIWVLDIVFGLGVQTLLKHFAA